MFTFVIVSIVNSMELQQKQHGNRTKQVGSSGTSSTTLTTKTAVCYSVYLLSESVMLQGSIYCSRAK